MFKLTRTIPFCLFTLFSATSLLADQVSMKNGDRLSGEIIRFDGKELILKSEFAGEVKIPWDAVTTVDSTNPLYVGVKDGQTIVGLVSTEQSQIHVRTEQAGLVTLPREAITGIRNRAAQRTYETEIQRLRDPRIVDLWTGHVDLGYAQSQGNAETTNITVNGVAARETPRDKIQVNFTSIYAQNDTTGESIVTANAIRGGVSYNLNVTPKFYVFASTDLEFDEFQSLDLRFVPAGGFGYHVFKTDRRRFDLLGGASLNREFFSTGLNRTSGEALLGEEFIYNFSENSLFREKLIIFPNLTNTGSYRINFDSTFQSSLLKWLAWQVTVSDRYLSNPVMGREKNDILFTTGLRFIFKK